MYMLYNSCVVKYIKIYRAYGVYDSWVPVLTNSYIWESIFIASLSHAQCSLPAAALELAPDSELTIVLYEIPRFQVEQVIGWNLIHCT